MSAHGVKKKARVPMDTTGLPLMPIMGRGCRVKDLTGVRTGMLLIGAAYRKHPVNGLREWLTRCDCGSVTYQRADYMLNGTTRSCGCLRDANRKVYYNKIMDYL